MTKSFREYLREAKKFLFLPDIKVNNKVVNWNQQKSEAKFLSQINERINAVHITDSDKLGVILHKGLSLKYDEFATGQGRNNDTCIRFKKSQFVVIFNKDELTPIKKEYSSKDFKRVVKKIESILSKLLTF